MNRRELLTGAGALALLPGCASLAHARDAPSPATSRSASRELSSLNKGWRFFEGDIAPPEIRGHGMSYANAKAGVAFGGAAPDFDDSEWATLTLPHDFASHQLPQPDANASQGYRRRGIAWYRRLVRLHETDKGKHLEIRLDGISTLATIWFNGTLVARNWSGYNSAYLDITPFATYGEALNSLVVRVDAKTQQGWWYEGAGIYRNTWLVKRSAVHIVTDGVFAHPVKRGSRWVIPIEVTVGSHLPTSRDLQVRCTLLDEQGRRVARIARRLTALPLEKSVATMEMAIGDPQLWSVESPVLYRMHTELVDGGAVHDEADTPCGFRTQRFDPHKGFFLNGRHVKLKGVCIHPDHAGVGVAVPRGILEYRLQRLKALGCNAIRCAHNAEDKDFYDLCDRMGFLVMDENRVFNLAPEHIAELQWLVRRDRNHPSVILWSVFNEEPMQGTAQGREMVRRMVHEVKRLDRTRPVTAAMNDGVLTPENVAQAVDVVGFNYQTDVYDAFHKAFPNVPIVSSEDTAAYMTRGEYKTVAEKHVVASYDDDHSWGLTHRDQWKAVTERDFVAGSFVWSGFDYHGEPTPHEWPSNSSFFGIMDLCGFEKTAFWIHKAQWVDEPVLRIVPHWNWPGREGEAILVMACHNLDEVELRLNGTLVARQPGERYRMNRWQVPYAPGRLEAIGYRSGRVVARDAVETTSAAVRLRLTPERTAMSGDGLDAQPFKVQALDALGRPVPTAQHTVSFRVEGGQLIGVGNGDPNDTDGEKGPTRRLFNGLAQAIVQTHEGTSGSLRLIAEAPGLEAAVSAVRIEPRAPAWAYEASPAPVQAIGGWRNSPIVSELPAGDWRPAPQDMNSWGWVGNGAVHRFDKSGYAVFGVELRPFATLSKRGGQLRFFKLSGLCEVFCNGVSLGRKERPEAEDARFALPAGLDKAWLTVRFAVVPGEGVGFGGARLTGP